MRKIVVGPQVVDYVAQRLGRGERYGLSAGLGVEEDGELIAGVVYNEFNHANVNMHVASNGKKNWLSKRFLWMCFDYPFNQLKVRRITAFVEDDRADALIFDDALGFKYEFTMQDAHPTGDIIVMKMTRADCKWLNIYKEPLQVAA